MSATQLSFPAFAAAQAASPCTPSASTPSVPADVVAHGTGSGGECTSVVLPAPEAAFYAWAKGFPHGFRSRDFRRAGFMPATAGSLVKLRLLRIEHQSDRTNKWFANIWSDPS